MNDELIIYAEVVERLGAPQLDGAEPSPPLRGRLGELPMSGGVAPGWQRQESAELPRLVGPAPVSDPAIAAPPDTFVPIVA